MPSATGSATGQAMLSAPSAPALVLRAAKAGRAAHVERAAGRPTLWPPPRQTRRHQPGRDGPSGRTKLDEKRKSRAFAPSTSDWEEVPAPFVADSGYPSFGPQGGEESSGGQDSQRVFVPVKVKKEDVNVIPVKDLNGARPVNLPQLRVRELQCDCDRWGIQTSGTQAEIVERLEQLYAGKAVAKKGCTKKFVQLKRRALQHRLPQRPGLLLRQVAQAS